MSLKIGLFLLLAVVAVFFIYVEITVHRYAKTLGPRHRRTMRFPFFNASFFGSTGNNFSSNGLIRFGRSSDGKKKGRR